MSTVKYRGAIGGKTDKTAVLPGFFKIERGGSSGAARPCIRSLIWLTLHASGDPEKCVFAPLCMITKEE